MNTDEYKQALRLLSIVLLAACATQVFSATLTNLEAGALSVTNPISFARAADVLERVRDNLPKESIKIRGELLCGGRRGKLDRAFYLDADLYLGRSPATACYTLRDGFGDTAEQLTITRQPNGMWSRDYSKGHPLQSAPAPAGDTLIGGSDVTWNDLSLAFLWWTDGVIKGRELVLERECLILEFTPPQAPRLTRVWIDENLLVLIKVEEYDADQKIQRRIAGRTITKVGDKWMIKDLDIRSWPGERREHRTLVKLNEVSAVAAEIRDQSSEVSDQITAVSNQKSEVSNEKPTIISNQNDKQIGP